MKTQVDPKQWIKNKFLSSQDQDSWRTRYLFRLGISKEIKQENNSIDNAINQKSNFKIYNTYSLGQFNLNFLTKTNQQVRNNYIKKLLINKILKQQPTKKYQSSFYHSLVIIFDWDDTILSTTYLGSVGFVQISSYIKNQLELLDLSAVNLHYYSYGNIFIITNATEGWIQYSSKLYNEFQADIYPKLIKSLIKIQQKLSLQEMDMKINIQEIVINGKFKLLRMSKKTLIFRQFYFDSDSHIQMDAAHILGKQFNQPLIKTIKFKQNPRPEELIKQQELVFQRFQQIYMNYRSKIYDNRKSSNKKTTNDE